MSDAELDLYWAEIAQVCLLDPQDPQAPRSLISSICRPGVQAAPRARLSSSSSRSGEAVTTIRGDTGISSEGANASTAFASTFTTTPALAPTESPHTHRTLS